MIFSGLTPKVILVSMISSSSLSLTIIYFCYFSFISIAISNAYSALAINMSVKLSEVLIYCGISRTIYFSYFLLDFARYSLNIYANFELYSSCYCNIVLFNDINVILVLIFAFFSNYYIRWQCYFCFFCKNQDACFCLAKFFSTGLSVCCVIYFRLTTSLI